MSANPLLALPVNVAPPTQPAAPSPSPRDPHSGTHFNTHLQSAQRHHQPAAPDDRNDSAHDSEQSRTQQSAPAQTGQTPDQSTAQSAGQMAAPDDTLDDSTSATNADSLASTLLGLIDHAADSTPTTTTTASTAGNASAKAQANTKLVDTAPASTPAPIATPVLPMPLPATLALPSSGSKGATDTQQTNGNATRGIAALAGWSLPTGIGMTANAFDTEDASTDETATTPSIGSLAQAATGDAVGTGSTVPVASDLLAAPNAAPTASNDTTNSPNLSALGNLTIAGMPSAPDNTSTHNLALNAPVGSSSFAKELGQQITWLSGQDIKQAQIRLNPQDLGPLDVKVSVEHGRVDVAFIAQHPDTVAAVQQGLSQLHHMLGGQGLSLGHATVGQHAQQQFGSQQGQHGRATPAAGEVEEVGRASVVAEAREVVGLVDAFA